MAERTLAFGSFHYYFSKDIIDYKVNVSQMEVIDAEDPMSDSAACQCQVQDRKIPGFVIDNILRRLFRPPERFLTRYLQPGNTAADLGCGPGFFTLPMAKIVGSGGKVYAVDFDPRSIEHLRRRAERQGRLQTIEPCAASAAEIGHIQNASVDFVLAEGLLCCMKDHLGAIREIRRILASRGRAYLSVIKFSKPGDPRGVSKEEWESLLSRFPVLDRGENLVKRWAVVMGGGGSKPRETELVGQVR